MEPKLLETTLDGHRPARRTCWRALAEALRERKAGKANTFKRVTASVSPVINTGWQTATQHGNRTGNRARPSESGDWVTFNPRTTDIEPSDVDARPLPPPALSTPALFRDCASALRCTLMQSRGPSMAFQTCQAALGNPSTALTVLESKPGVSVQGQAIMGPMTTPQHG